MVGTVPFLATPIARLGAPSRAVTGPIARAIAGRARIEPAPGFDERHAEVTAEHAPPRRVWGSREVAELRWRFQRRPGVPYEIWNLVEKDRLVGFAVTRRMEIGQRDTLVVCDSWARDSSTAMIPALLDRILGGAAGERPDLAIVIASPTGTTGPRALLAAGMAPVPQRFLPQPVAVIGGPMQADRPADSWLRTGGLSEWHVTPYDWDVF